MHHLLQLVQYVAALFLIHAFLGVQADVPFSTDLEAYQNGTTQPMQNFFSAPDIWAPIFQVNKFEYDKSYQAPYLFMSGNYTKKPGHFGFHIFSAKDLSLIYTFETRTDVIRGIRPYNFKGMPVLGFWARGGVWVMNQHYQTLYETTAYSGRPGFLGDSHESSITNDGTVISIYREIIKRDLSIVGGPKQGSGYEVNHFTEIDPVTGKVLFEFSIDPFFDITDSFWAYKLKANYDPTTWVHHYDAFHMNSVQKTPEGDYLVSARHLSSLFMVDGKTGTIKWIMGGKKNQFKDISENGSAVFMFQHHAQLIGHNRIMLFDNVDLHNRFCDATKRQCSRAIEFEFDVESMTIKLIKEWYHPQSLNSASRGGVQRLPNGGTLVAWGQNPMYTEYTPDGEVVMDIQRGPVDFTVHGDRASLAYRVFKGDWEGKPLWGPNISVDGRMGMKKAYVSWNGATEVAKWVLLMSGSLNDLDGPSKVLKESPRMGFETSFDLPEADEPLYVRIAALDKNGVVIGSTPAAELWSGTLHLLDYQITQVKGEHPQSNVYKDQSDKDRPVSPGPTFTSPPFKSPSAKSSASKSSPPKSSSSKTPTMYEMASDLTSEMTAEAIYVIAGVALGFLALTCLMLRKRRSGFYRLRRLVMKDKSYDKEQWLST